MRMRTSNVSSLPQGSDFSSFMHNTNAQGDRHLTMGNKGSKSEGTRRNGKEHAAPSTSTTGQAIVPHTDTTVKKQSVTEPNKVDDHGGQTPAGASGESQLHSSPNVSPATCKAGGVYTNEESTTAPQRGTQQATMTSTTRQVFSPPTETVEKQIIAENQPKKQGEQIPTGASGESQPHSYPNVSPATSTAGGSIHSTQLVASCVPSGVSSIIAQSSDITQQATMISSAHRTPGENIKGILAVKRTLLIRRIVSCRRLL